MIERQRRQNNPGAPSVHGRTIRVSETFLDLFRAWLDLQIARQHGWMMTAEMKIASRLPMIPIEGWPQVFWYIERGPIDNPWGRDSYEFTVYSPEFDSDIEDWRPEFTKRDGEK